MTVDGVAVIGGGIVGLAVARQLLLERPGSLVHCYEKEAAVGSHQTGHNSGVLHAGLYYAPGSLKARLCRHGGALLREFAAEHSVPVADLGKVVVARDERELPALQRIEDRARANQVPGLARLGPRGLADVEPHVRAVAALHSPHTAVVDFAAIAQALATEIGRGGGDVRLNQRVKSLVTRSDGVEFNAGGQVQRYRAVVLCAGGGTDRLRRSPELRLLAFRGNYYTLGSRARSLVHGLVYPVPDPRYPFLGIHLTRRIDGQVLVGPNAVAALAPEGYRWSDIDPKTIAGWLGWPGSWSLARRHWRTGANELVASLSKRIFAAAARSYVPGIANDDLLPAPAGVRAQAVDRRGRLVDDFVIDTEDGLVVVRNAPSPAATSSLAIAEHVAGVVPRTLRLAPERWARG